MKTKNNEINNRPVDNLKNNKNQIADKIICPVCGGEMDESYLSKQYCNKCEQQLAEKNDW